VIEFVHGVILAKCRSGVRLCAVPVTQAAFVWLGDLAGSINAALKQVGSELVGTTRPSDYTGRVATRAAAISWRARVCARLRLTWFSDGCPSDPSRALDQVRGVLTL